MNRVFVIGGAGFIGSHLVSRLLKEPGVTQVTVYDDFSSGTRFHLQGSQFDPRMTIQQGDVSDVGEDADLIQSMDGHETVFHLAANPDISKAETDPELDFWEGTHLMQRTLEAVRVTGAERIVFFSGSGVYGENPLTSFMEDSITARPVSPYGASKLACEALISAYSAMFGINATIFRFANVVGPRQTHGVGYDFINRLKSNPLALSVLGDGSQRKSYVHVDDVMRAIFSVPYEQYGVYNVASEDSVTVREIAELAVEISHTPTEISYGKSDRGWNGDVPRIRLNCDKIRSLGWLPLMNSKQSMASAMQSIRNA
jgi:UDP-glucose 4-epimerase